VAVDGQIGGDGHDPSFGLLPKVRPPEVGSGQSLLGHVLGVAPVSEDTERHPVSKPKKLRERLLESHPLAHVPAFPHPHVRV
jgi:hypothetical protein